MTGVVYLVGAGPGDPELITERGIRAMRRADLVLYDALVHPDLLRHVSANAVVELVGKRAGQPSARQSAINVRMIEAARSGLAVVRLKGGDPFLFGRGAEEAEALFDAGVAFQVVPGVPSPLGMAAYAGVPLTDRRYGSSILFVTASEANDKEAGVNWQTFGASADTLVLFMATQRLREISASLIAGGRASSTPVVVTEWASLPKQRTRETTLEELASNDSEHGMGLPSLVVVGEVARHREKMRWFERLPLFGRRVLILRPQHQADELLRSLRDEGAEARAIPSIEIGAPTKPSALDDALQRLREFSWVVFTSANGVRASFDRMRTLGSDARALGGVRVCTIGPKTAEALASFGVQSDLTPSEYRGEAVAAALLPLLQPQQRVLILRAEVARDALPNALRNNGIAVEVVAAYQNLLPGYETQELLRHEISESKPDTVVFTAPSTVRNFVEIVGVESLRECVRVAIGPVTGDELRGLGMAPHIEAAEYTAQGIVRAMIENAASRSTGH